MGLNSDTDTVRFRHVVVFNVLCKHNQQVVTLISVEGQFESRLKRCSWSALLSKWAFLHRISSSHLSPEGRDEHPSAYVCRCAFYGIRKNELFCIGSSCCIGFSATHWDLD